MAYLRALRRTDARRPGADRALLQPRVSPAAPPEDHGVSDDNGRPEGLVGTYEIDVLANGDFAWRFRPAGSATTERVVLPVFERHLLVALAHVGRQLQAGAIIDALAHRSRIVTPR